MDVADQVAVHRPQTQVAAAAHWKHKHALCDGRPRTRGAVKPKGPLTRVADGCDVAGGLAGRHGGNWAFVACETLYVTESEETQRLHLSLRTKMSKTHNVAFRSHRRRPVEVPEDTRAVFAHADEDAVGFAHEQAGDVAGVSVQMNLRFHLYLCGLRTEDTKSLVLCLFPRILMNQGPSETEEHNGSSHQSL